MKNWTLLSVYSILLSLVFLISSLETRYEEQQDELDRILACVITLEGAHDQAEADEKTHVR